MRIAMHWFALTAVSCCWLIARPLPADEDPPVSASSAFPSETPQEAIARGLAFLRDDAKKWRAERECSTCHHGTFTVFVFTEAKYRGWNVDADFLADSLKWTKERLLNRIDEPRDTRPGWSMVNSPALILALMAQVVPGQEAISAEELNRIRGHLVRHQEAGGEWAWSAAPAKNRPPPFFESDEVATLLGLLAMPVGEEAISDELRQSRQRAIDWFHKTEPTDTTQAVALRLLWKSRSEPKANLLAEIEAFLSRQSTDGGFGQLKDRASDAYATGQALYVLNVVGVPADRPQVRRAVEFLVNTQRPDGSWPMIRRGHPEVTPGPFIVPITYFGAAWGTLGLLRTDPK